MWYKALDGGDVAVLRLCTESEVKFVGHVTSILRITPVALPITKKMAK